MKENRGEVGRERKVTGESKKKTVKEYGRAKSKMKRWGERMGRQIRGKQKVERKVTDKRKKK